MYVLYDEVIERLSKINISDIIIRNTNKTRCEMWQNECENQQKIIKYNCTPVLYGFTFAHNFIGIHMWVSKNWMKETLYNKSYCDVSQRNKYNIFLFLPFPLSTSKINTNSFLVGKIVTGMAWKWIPCARQTFFSLHILTFR